MADMNLDDLPRTRKDAARLGIKHYFTGVRCLHGHLERRNAKSRMCLTCGASAKHAKRETDPEAARANERKYHSANSEKINARKRELRAANPAHRRAWEKTYRETHLEAARESGRRSRFKRGQKCYESVKLWRLENPDKRHAQTHRRRARKSAADGSHTGADLIRIRKEQKDRCAYCSKSLRGKGHLDHIVSLSKGGSNYPSNLQWLCAPCNTSKNARDPIEFAQSMGKLV